METMWQLWEHRNAKVHETGQVKTHLQVVREIRYLFNQPRSEWPSAVHYLFKDPTKVLKGSLPQLQQWLQAAQTCRNTDPRLLDRPFTGARLLRSIRNHPTLNPTRPRATIKQLMQALRLHCQSKSHSLNQILTSLVHPSV